MEITTQRSRTLLTLFFVVMFTSSAMAIIGPIRRNSDRLPLLMNCQNIQLVNQLIDLYHHPLGIWLVTCTSRFRNLMPQPADQEFACPAGFDINMVDSRLYCDVFKNFRVFVNGKEINTVIYQEKCINYVERIGMEWTNDDYSGIGFVNTWPMHFEGDEEKTVTVSFSFVVKKPAIAYDPDIREDWYQDQMNWLKLEYEKRAENEFKLPLNMGSFWALYVDSLAIRSYFSQNWLTIEPMSNRQYKPEQQEVYRYSEPLGFYSPPEVDLQDLTDDDVHNMSKAEIQLLRNAFFAKYGRTFTNRVLKLYFANQPWYAPDIRYHNFFVTDRDKNNIRFLYRYEKENFK